MRKLPFLFYFLLNTQLCLGQVQESPESVVKEYFAIQREISQSVSHHIYSDFPAFNSLDEVQFIFEIDSLRDIYFDHLNRYSDQLDQNVVDDEIVGIDYFFDRLLLEYPLHHETYTGRTVLLSDVNQERLKKNFRDFNNPELLSNNDFLEYIKSFLSQESRKEIKNESYARSDNKYLHAFWNLSEKLFNKQEVQDFLRHLYLSKHIENYGIKNIEPFYHEFVQTRKNTEYMNNIQALYEQSRVAREDHLIETYKRVDDFDLDIHLFLPDTTKFSGNRPVMVYFHGGSWSEGKPDWFFSAGKTYSSQGWVTAAVEYRIMGRHGTLPFQSVLDAKSAIRWLRSNAGRFNINPSKIVATGNSAGGHLVLATVLTDTWNEPSDDLDVSPVPDVLMVIAGVYDLTVDNTKWIVKDLENKSLVLDISPNHLIKNNLPPMLLIHGENDMNAPYSTAEYFTSKMKEQGNEIEFHTIDNAGHFIWFGPHASEVSQIRKQYLEKTGFN